MILTGTGARTATKSMPGRLNRKEHHEPTGRGIEINPAIIAPLDPGFLPASLFTRKYRELVSASGGVPLRLALERGDGSISRFCTSVVPLSAGHLAATLLYVERIVKFLLWQRGGWRVYVGGPTDIGEHIKAVYSSTGARKFDFQFMSTVYEHPFEVVVTSAAAVPEAKEVTMPLGRHLDIEGHLLRLGIGAAPPRSLAGQQDQPVHEQERRGEQRPAEDGTERVLEQ